MVATWRRAATGTLLGLFGLLLSGCHVQGTFDVLSESRVAVDLTVTGAVDCPDSVDALKLTVASVRDAAGAPACHVTGETDVTSFSPFGIEVSRAAEYLVLRASLSGRSDEWPTSDVQVRFPGQVVTASRGQANGTAVRITDLGELAQGSGLTVVAIDRPGPATWVIAAAAGVVGGVLATLLVLLAVRVNRRRRHQAAVEELVLQPADAPEDDDRGDDGEEPTLALPVRHPAGEPSPPTDHDWFARPPEPAGAPPLGALRPDMPAPERPAEPPDDSVWASPPDRG